MALAELDTPRPAAGKPGVAANRVIVSAAAELFWGLRALYRMERDAPQHLDLDRSRARRLAERVRQFWNDGMVCAPELFVLAAKGGHLEDEDAGALIAALPRLSAEPDPQRMLTTEDPPDRSLIEMRLRRLASDPKLAAAYARLLEAVWAAQSPQWRADGRAFVRRTAAAWQAQVERGASIIAAGFVSEASGCSAELVGMARDAAASERLLIAPTFFGTGFCIVDAGPVTIMSSPGGRNADPLRELRGAARVLASRCKALADPTRMAMCALLHTERLTVGEIARRLELAQPTVSAHVAVLRTSGLLREQHEGRITRYALDAARLDALLAEMRTLVVDRAQ